MNTLSEQSMFIYRGLTVCVSLFECVGMCVHVCACVCADQT